MKALLALLLALGATAPALANEVSVVKTNGLGAGVAVNAVKSSTIGIDAIALENKSKVNFGAAATVRVFHNLSVGVASVYQNDRRKFSAPQVIVGLDLIGR